MARDLAIDLGTANTLVYARGRGIVLNEPTVIALNSRSQDVLAIGHEAWQMIGRTPGYIVAVRPLRQGAITDFDITERMIRLLLQRCGVSRFNRPRVLICVPSAITSVERRAVTEAARRAGASEAFLMEQPMAAAIGAGLQIHEPVGNMVVDVGGGTSESAVISLGGIVAVRALRCGGFDLDSAIQLYVRRVHGIAIGERTAEEVKLAIGSAGPYGDEVHAEVRGPRGHDRHAEDREAVARRGARSDRRTDSPDSECGGRVPRRGSARARAGHHLPRSSPRRWRIFAAGPGEATRRRDRRSGSRGRHAARVRRARCGPLPRVVRLSPLAVHGGGLTP